MQDKATPTPTPELMLKQLQQVMIRDALYIGDRVRFWGPEVLNSVLKAHDFEARVTEQEPSKIVKPKIIQ